MQTDSPAAVVLTVNLVTTYLLHSTLLLGLAGLALRLRRPNSHTLVEWLWKSAAVIPLATAPLQLLGGFADPVFNYCWMHNVSSTSGISETMIASADTVAIGAGKQSPNRSMIDAGARATVFPKALLEETEPAQLVSSPGETVHSTKFPATGESAMPKLPFPPSLEDVFVTNTLATTSPPVTSTEPARPVLPWHATLLAGLAVVVVGGGALRFFLLSWRFHFRIKACRLVRAGPVYDVLSRLLRKTTSRQRVRLLKSDSFTEPVVFGLFRWTIIAPAGVENKLTRRELEALFAHELAHLVRGDAWWLLIGRLLCSCLPFQPLNFLARKSWQRAAECQCDDWAVQRTAGPVTLARCLTKVAEWRFHSRHCAEALPAGGAKSTLSERVERLLADRPNVDPWSRSQRRCLLTAVTLCVALVVCWRGPRTTLLAQPIQAVDVADFMSAEDLTDRGLSLDVSLENNRNLAGELRLLNAELQQLEREMQTAGQLLQDSGYGADVKTIAASLTARMQSLKSQRRLLTAASGTGLVTETETPLLTPAGDIPGTTQPAENRITR